MGCVAAIYVVLSAILSATVSGSTAPSVSSPRSGLLRAHEQSPYQKYGDLVRPGVENPLPTSTGSESWAYGQFGHTSRRRFESQYEMHPFMGSSLGGTQVRFVFRDRFPERIKRVWCRFGGSLENPLSWHYKPNIGVEVMCISPSGIPNTRLKAGISLNGAEFFPSGHQGQDFYFYREPQVTAVMPPKGDIRGGTRVVFYLAEDYLGNALAAMHSPEHFNDAVAAVRCKFDDVIVPSEGVHMCPPPGHKGQMIPCVVCMTPVASDAGQVQVKLALNSVDFSTASAPFVFMDLFPVRTHRSEFAWRSLSDNLADNQRFVDEEGQQITPGDVPELEEALTEFYGEFYGAVDTMSRATPPEYAFYDGLYSFYSTGAVATDMAEVCITAMRPSTGPAEGGTTVQVKVQGSIPFGHADFYCVFRQTMQIIRVTSAAYDSEDDSIVLTCTMPPGDERSINYVGISLDGKATSPLGAPFYYHSDLELSSISPSSGPSHGGTTVTVTFAESQVLPSGTDSDVVHASCRFSYVSSSGVTTTKATAGVYSPAIGSVHATVACVTPGFSVEIPSGDISVAVSLNGAEYGTSQLNHTGVRYTLTSSETLSADQIPYMGFYGLELLQPPLIDSSGPSEAGTTYPEQALVEVSEVGSAPFVSFSYSTARCLTYLQTSIATLDGLLVEGDLVLPDYSTKGYSTDVAPEFQTGLLDYTALVPYQLYNGFSLSGNTSDRFSNMFVHGQPVPRLGRSVVTAHNSTGDATSVELTVLSSDSSTSLTYAVTVLRDLPGTEDGVADLAITGATGRDAGISPAWNSTVYSGYSVRVRFLNSVWLLFAPSMVDRYAKATVSDNSTGSSETVGFKMPSTHANLTLPVGFTLVTVTGVSEGGVISSTSVYEILVERVEAMTVSTVELVTITTLYPEAGGNLLSPSPWDPATTDYTLTLIYPEDEVTFQVLTTDDAQATTASMNNGTDVDVEYNGTYFATGIEVGTNTLLLTSVAEDGVNTTVYNITIIRLAKSSDATLSDLYTEACSDDTQGQLEPNFTSSTYMYDAVVPHQCANDAFYDRLLGTMSNSQDITLTPVCSYYFCSSISVALPNGVTLSGSNGTSFVVDIPTATRNGLTKDASSMVNVTVTAEDETTTATYYLNVTRLARSTIAGLLNMTIDGGSNSLYPTSGVLYQGHWGGAVGFNGSVSRYFMEVESEVSTLTVGTENNQMFAVTTVELNPSAAGSNSTGAEAIITNSTGNSVRALVSGSNNTVRIRVHSEAFQPSQKFAYYSPTAYAEYIITVFRRTKSTSAVLKDLSVAVGSLAEIPTVRLGAHVSLSRNFSSTVLSYPATVVYSVAGVSVNPVLPATGGSVSMLDNVNRATIAVGGSATASGANSTTQSLSRGFTRVLIVVTAEDGTTTQTYSLNVTRLEPNLDTTLKGLVPSSGWLVLKGSSGADGNEKAPSAAFSPSVTTYQVRAVHSIPYLGAVVPNNVTSIAFTPYANASLNGVAPVRITVNGVQVADSAISQHVALSDSSFPAPSVREIPIVVTAEDGSVSTTYTIKVTRAPIQPDPSFWIQFYRLKGGPTESTVDAPATATGAVKYWVTTDYVMPLRLEIDAGLWNSTFYSSMPGLSTNYSPVSGLVFQPVVSVYGSPYKPYGPSVNLPANSTVKNVNFTVNGGTVGEVTVKVTAYGLDVLGSFSYGLEHGFMALSASTLTGEVNLIPGVATFLLEPHDMYGNVILDSKRVYADDEIDAFVCPDISGTTKFPGNGTVPADCKCGVETGCSKPGTGEVARRTDGRYNVFYSVSRSGINFLRMEGSYYYPTPVPSPDVLRGTPLQVKVEGTALGVRSFVETILYRSFRVEEDPGFFFVHARDDFGNDLFEGGQGDRLSVATRPALRDEAGNPISGIVTDVSVPGERGKYRIDLPTTLAAQYEIEVVLNGRFQIAGSGFVLAILPGTFAAENTPYTLPQRIVAGKTTVVQIRATDRYGNWLTFDDYSDYLSASVMQGRFRRRGLLQSYSTLDIPVKISKSPENNYTATFTAPNATSLSYGVWVFAYSYPGKETRTAVSTVPEAFELQPDEPKANMTEFVIPSLGVAGELRLGVRGIDQYGNPSPDGPWRVVATAGPQTVEAELLPKPLDSDPFTQTIDLGAAGLNVSGTYSIRMYLGQQEVTGDVFPASIKVVAGTISSRSAVSSVPSQVTIGTLMTIYIDSLDKYGNRIDVGGEASAIVPYVSNVNDPLDVVPATVMDNRQGSYSITFSPAKSGTFSVALRFNGELKEPLQRFLAIAQSTAASDYTVATSASARAGDVYQEGVGRLVTFTVTPKAGVSLDLVLKSALTATLEFEATGAGRVLPVSPAASSGVRTVSFSETRSGRYRLILRIEGLDLLGSPYTLDILAGLPVDYYVEALPQLSYKAGEETILYMHILDSYGNTIPVDTSTELAVTFEQLPGGEVALGNVESSLVTGYPEGNGAGHKATALLTAAAIYRLSINLNLGLDKMTLCLRRLSSSSAAQGSCLPEITVVPGPAFPPACQLKGSGALPMVAGDQVSLTVISYDKYENTVNRDYAATSLLYKAAMEGPEGGINSTINQFDFYYSPGENVHRAQYSITVAGKYQLDVRKVQPRDEDPADLEGRLHPYTVGSTPLSVTVSPGKMVPSKTFIEPIAKSHVVAQENALHFTLRDAYSNVVTSNTEADVKMIVRGRGVTLTTGQGGEASLEFQPGGTYVVAYTTAIAGEYTAQVFLSDAPSTSISFQVLAGQASASSTARGAGLFAATAGTSASFTVLPTDRYGNQITRPSSSGASPFAVSMAVVATGDGSTLTSKTVPVPPANYTVAWNDDQRGYVVDYRVTVAGTLSIGVTLDGKHITSSPFSAQVAAGATAAQRSVLTGVGLRGTVVGRRVEFHLQAKDSFGNLKSSGGDPFRLSLRCLTPSCGGSGALLAGATINDIGDGTYTGSYMSSTEGTFSLEVTLRNDAVGVVPSRSPFSVSISAAAGPISLRNTEALGLGLSEGRAGTPAEFTIIAADTLGIQLTEGGNLFSAEVKQFLPADGVEPSGPGFSLASRKSGTPNSIVDNQDGTYTVSFTANTAAYYSVMVWGDAARTTALAGSWPVKMRMYAAPTVASACLLDPGQPLPTVVPAGRIIKTGILAFDRYGNRQQYVPGVQDNDDFSIAAVSDTLPNVIGSARMSADKQGYDLELVVSTVGIYRIDIRLKNRFTGIQETIGTGSTYPLQVTSGVLSAERSTASGLGLLGGIVGQTLRVSVLVSDTGGNPVAVSGLPSGICQARLQPQRGPNAGCTMGGSSVGPSTGICDCIPIACQSALGSPNRYNLDMAATCAGDYVLRVLLGNSPINSSPFPLTISPGETAPSRVVLAGTGLSRATAGSEATFTMQAADAYGNLRYKGGDTFAAWLEHSPAGGVNPAPDVYATVTDSGDGTYSAVYTPEGIGSHQLYVQLAGKSTGESPYTVTVRASETSASASYIIGGKLDSFRAGEVVELTVVAVSDTGRRQTDGPSDRFDVSMSPDGNGFGFVLTPVAERTSQDAATYEIRFTAERVVFNGDGSRRPYRLEVTLAGKHVKGSPMELHVRPGPVAASRSALFGAGDVSPEVKDDYGSVAGVRRDLLLQMRDIYGNDADYDLFAEIPRVSLRVAGMPQDPFTAGVDVSDHIEVANTEDGRFIVSYLATVAGRYQLTSEVNGKVIADIQNIPAVVVPGPHDLKSFHVDGPVAGGVVFAGVAQYFTIEPRDTYGNFRPDDGRLICFSGSVSHPAVDPSLCSKSRLSLDMEMKTGSVLAGLGTANLAKVDLTFEPRDSSADARLPWRAGMYRGVFEARIVGQLVTTLTYGDDLLGPFTAKVASGEVDPSRVTLSGTGSFGAALGPAGSRSKTMQVFIEPRDVFGNIAQVPEGSGFEVTVVFADKDLGVIEGQVDVSEIVFVPERASYMFTYVARAVGQILVDITFDGVPISNGESVVLDVFEEAKRLDPAFTYAEGPGIAAAVVGERTFVNVVLMSISSDIDCVQDSLGNPLLPRVKRQRGCRGTPHAYSAGPDIVKARLDFQDIFDIVDHGNGTYSVYFRVQSSGSHALEISIGPDLENVDIGERSVPIGFSFGMYNLQGIPAATTQADVRFFDLQGEALPSGSLIQFYSGQPLKLEIQPKDEFGNLQDYLLAPEDEFRVDVIYEQFMVVEVDYLTRKSSSSLNGATFYYEAQVTMERSGLYLIDVSFRNSLTGESWESVATTTRVEVLPGIPDAFLSEITGEGIKLAAAGTENNFRLRLLDAAGNALGDGLDQKPLVEALLEKGSYWDETPLSTPTMVTPSPTMPFSTPDPGTTALPNPTQAPVPAAPTPAPTPTANTAPTSTSTATAASGSTPISAATTMQTPAGTPEAFSTIPTPTARRRSLLQKGTALGGVPPVVSASLLTQIGHIPIDISYDPEIEQYRGSYKVFTSGLYALDVRLYGRKLAIPGYVKTRVLAGEIFTPSCEVRGTGAGEAGGLPAGVTSDFTIIARDENGNALSHGGASWNVFLESATDIDPAQTTNWVPNGRHLIRATESEDGGITDLGDGTYRVRYKPLVAGTYLLNVMRGSDHALGSPMVVDVRAGATVANQSTLICSPDQQASCGLNDLQAGSQGVFYIQARDRFAGNKTTADDEFFYSVTGAGGYSKDSLATARGDRYPGQYRAAYNTEIAGPLKITATLRGSLVATITTVVYPGRVDAQRCTMSSAAFPVSSVWTPGSEPDLITITSRDAYGNRLSQGGLEFELLMSKTDESYAVTLTVEDNRDGTYQTKYINKEPGHYLVTGKLNLESIPFQSLTLVSGPAVIAHTEVSSASGAINTLPSFRAGRAGTFRLKFKDVWLNSNMDGDTIDLVSMQVVVSQGSTQEILVPGIDFVSQADLQACMASSTSTAQLDQCQARAGAFEITVTPRLSGMLRLYLSFQDDVLIDPETTLPFAAEVLPGPASPETTLVTGSALNGCLGGRPCWLQVSLADAHGNKLDKRGLLGVEQSLSLTYSLQGESGPTPVAMASIVQSTAELDNGNQRFEFTPPAFPSGEYLMRVTASLVAQVASSGAESGVIAEPVIVVYRGNDALDAGKSGVVDSSGVGLRPGSFLGNVVAGEKGTLLVQVRDRNGVDYMESVGSDFIAVDIQPDVADLIIAEDRPGLLEISFRGTRAGVYSAAVKIGSSRMVMGLYEMGVVPKWPSSPSESRLEIVSDGRRGNNVPSLTAEAGVALSVQVQLIDTYGNAQRYVPEDGPEAIVARLKKRLVADEEELPTVPCAVYDNRDGTYSASCTASLTGDYDLEVLLRPDGAPALVPLGQNRMNDPPVLVTIKHGEVFPPASSLEPSAAELTGVKLASGAPFEFSIVARDSFGNRHDSGGLGFEVGVQRLGRGRQPEVDTTVLPATNGTYLARLVASQAGTYRITVLETASGLVVDKAFEIVVEAGAVDLKKATVAGGGLQGGVAGEPLRFILRLYDAYSNPSGGQASLVSITAKPNAATEEQAGPWQSSLIGAVVNETAPGYMQISFALKSVGEHNVDILLGGVRVPGSPFKVVSSPRPPPALIRAAFDSSLSSILVTFDQRTDRGGEAFKAAQTARTGACGSVLAPAVVVKLGNAPVCDWVTDDSLRIFVGRGATILPTSLSAEGTQMQMLRNVVYNKARNSYAAANRVDIAVPLAIDETAKPVAVLSAPTVIGFCADLELDATPSFGGASRDLELAFSASATDRLSESISTALADAVRQSSVAGLVTVPAGAMDAGRVYTLRVAATNFLGLTDVASVTVRKSELPLPTVRIEGPAQRQVLRASGATVSVDVKMPDVTCLAVAARPAGAESRIVYNWTLVDGPDILESDFPSKSAYRLHVASLSTRYLYIPGNTLRSGVLADGSLFKYVFAVNVQMEGNSILSASANVGLSVLPEPISARIQGGDQVISPGSALALDVVAIDNENSPGPFSYTWLCQKDGEQSCFEADSSTLKVLVTAAERLELDEGTLSPGRYTFTVHVSREPLVPTRMVSSSVRITVSGGLSALSSGSIPDGGAVVVAQLPDSQDGSNAGGEGSGNGGSSGPGAEGPDPEAAWAISISAPAALEVPSSGRLLLQGVITPPPGASTVDVSLLWSCVEGDLSSPGALAAAAENSLQDSYLSLRPGSLTGGQLYRFRLEGGSMITGGVASEVAIRVAAAPWAGTLEVVSPQGVTASGRPRALELVSKLALMARDWNSGAVYDFSYVKNVEEILSAEGLEAASWRDFASLRVVTSQERYLGRAPEGSSTLAAILPEGTHMVVAYITSATGGQARVVFPHLFEVEQPPRLRRAMLQEDMVTQAQRSIDVALSPALAQGDLTSALQFVEIYASLYAGNAPAAPLGSCSLGSMELPTQLVTKTAIGIQGLLPSFRLRSTQDVCNMAELVQDPTQTSTAVVEEVLRALLEMLEGGDLLLRGLSCGADIISHAIANAESACGITQQGRNQLLLRSAQKAVSVLGKATVSTEGLRAGMQPIIFDTMQMAIEVSSHRQSRAAGEAISGKGGAGVAASASYDISFSEPGTPPLGPSTSAGVLEVHSTLTVFTWVNPLADQRQLERLASLPASITLRAVRINRATLGSGAATTVEDAALPAVTATQLTRAPAIKSTAGFSPILYVWRGADWAAPVGGNGTSFREGDAAWGSYFPGQLPLGLEADLPGTVTFAIWLRDPLPPRTPPPPPPTGDKPTAPAPTAAPPVVIEDAGNGVPSWFLWAIPVMAASALALAVGVFLIYRRRVQRNRLQELHPSEDQEDRDEKAEAKARGLDNGDGTPIGSPTQSERGALLADGGGWEIEQRHALSGAEQAERAAAREAEFRREADVESDAGTDIGLSDDEAEEHEAMQYIVADPFKNVPAKPLPRQHVSQATAVTGHFQAVPRPGSEAASAREPLFDNKRPTRLLQAERMRSGAVQPNQPRSRASLEPAEGGDAPPRWSTINGEHWTGRSQPQGPGRRPNDGKY